MVFVLPLQVKRIEGYYVMANIVPLLLLTYMVFVTYAMERSDLEARMASIRPWGAWSGCFCQ